MKKGKKIVLLVIIILFLLTIFSFSKDKNREIMTIKSDAELYQLYKGRDNGNISIVERLLTMPFSSMIDLDKGYIYEDIRYKGDVLVNETSAVGSETTDGISGDNKDYSSTNIQVEGVDEADIIKTDGDYIYSISENKVIITNVKDSENPKIEAEIYNGEKIPYELLLYKDKLVIISTSNNYKNHYNYYNYYSYGNTFIEVYDLNNKNQPKKLKSLEFDKTYYTTRCIDGKLYVFAEGYLEEDNKKIKRDYKEDNETKEIALSDIHYIKDGFKNYQTIIVELDLNTLDDSKVSSYLINIANAYISKDNIYLLDNGYSDGKIDYGCIFGLKGVFGLIDFLEESETYYGTKIYKFNIDAKKGVTYQTKTDIKGHTLNQYSLDEKDGNLRLALETYDGTRVAILDENLKLLGETEKVEENEDMYTSRFIGDRAYLVTYRNTDPLFVVDLSNTRNPRILGELKIPGYSTYLHPYDENHLIGFGMDTKETINRSIDGDVISTSVRITGMKMSLFDVSDVDNPKEIDKTTIGDSRTVSAILTNPKALLFSKEKSLLAIPVNNYQEDFSVEESDSYEGVINNFKNRNNYVSEGYFVYKIDLDGFNLKGVINHDNENKMEKDYYYKTKLLRGVYIDNYLYTVSETEIKVNDLSDLRQISQLIISKGEN